MKIEGKELSKEENYLDLVTYVPHHAKGDLSHPDCEQGVIISFNDTGVSVLYVSSRSVQMTDPTDLVFG